MPHDRLTPREREILVLIAGGHKRRKIAAILSISLNTVVSHRTKVMKKLEVHSQAGLIIYAVKNRLMNIDE